jgi:hypothetical protein
LVGLALLVLPLAACEGLSQSGVRSKSHSGMNGGRISVEIKKANGSAEQDLEVESGYPGAVLEADVTLTVGKGSFRIELMGEDGQVTLSLEARNGQTVSGHGQIEVDAFGDASYRVTAVEAEDVAYTIEYAYR